MQPPALLPDDAQEADRLDVLSRYAIEGSAQESAYDDLAALTAQLCDAPMAAITFVGRDRQWFKARTGFDFNQTPRTFSICATVMHLQGVVEFQDVREVDHLVCVNAMTQGRVVFYASCPIQSPEGAPLGALCVMDDYPRQLDAKQRIALEGLGRMVTHLLGLRRADLEARAAIQQQEKLNSALLHEATLDGLTRIFNRSFLQRLIEDPDRVASLLGEHYALILIDADHFKAVNDLHGHAVGDRVLVGLAAAIREVVRTNDCAVRYGGDEFVVLLAGASLETAMHVAERIREHFLQSFAIRELGVTLSMGVAERAPGELLPTLLKRADRALYIAKDHGRNRIIEDRAA